MIRPFSSGGLKSGALIALSLALLGGSAALIEAHTIAVRQMKEIGLPAALRLPQIEERADILREQNEAAELQALLRGSTEEELLRLKVLPKESDTGRLLQEFDVLVSYLQSRKFLSSFSPVTVGDPAAVDLPGSEEPIRAYPLTFGAQMTEEGLETFLLFVDLSGLLTVSDALSSADIERLLLLTERENPAAVTALEYFLSTDLLRYAAEPKPYEEQLLKSFSSPAFEEGFRTILSETRIGDARRLLADLHQIMKAQELWPLRFLSLRTIRVERRADGTLWVQCVIDALSRGA